MLLKYENEKLIHGDKLLAINSDGLTGLIDKTQSFQLGESEKQIDLFFVGHDVYERSASYLSPFYVRETKRRYNYGFMSAALREGHQINIHPATKAEMNWINNKLLNY